MTIYALTGHRPPKLGLSWAGDTHRDLEVMMDIAGQLTGDDPRLITGMALGIDMLGAEAAIQLGIPFTAAIPFRGQERRWPQASQDRYHALLERAHKVIVVTAAPGVAAFQARNVWMVDHAHVLLAYWDGTSGGTSNALRYARRTDITIVRRNP